MKRKKDDDGGEGSGYEWKYASEQLRVQMRGMSDKRTMKRKKDDDGGEGSGYAGGQ